MARQFCDGLPAPRLPEAPAQVPDEWPRLLEALPPTGRLMLIGPPDCGKTTLCWWLARELHPTARVALVDADVGQSRIGPPASVGWYRPRGKRQGFVFAGSTTPERRPASALHATVRACAIAPEGADWLILDTTGYLQGAAAVALKGAKIKALRPVHVVALTDDPGVDAALGPWLNDPDVTVHRLPRPPAAAGKGPQQRAQWRRRGFSDWLAGSNLRWLETTGRELRHVPAQELYTGAHAAQLDGLLLGLSDAEDRGICLGLLRSMDWRRGRILALCPEAAQTAQVLDFGCIRLEADGEQVARDRE